MVNWKILLWFVLFLPGSLGAQDSLPILRGRVWDDLPFRDFIRQLEQEKNIVLFTRDSWIDTLRTVPVKDSVYLTDYLDECLKGTGLQAIQYKSYYFIIPFREIEAHSVDSPDKHSLVIGNPMNEGKYKTALITGRVLDGKRSEPVPGAQVYCEQHKLATSTDLDGRFSIELPTGEQSLKFSFMGLNDEVRKLMIYESGSMEVELFEKAISLQQINVLADNPNENYRSASMGVAKMNMQSISKLSVLMGEPDLMKSMVMLPGVQSIGENAPGFNVRGGSADQNLILIHNAPVFNTSHLFGFFSAFHPSLVRDVTLFKSSIPARFGGRLSSVMDITLRKGNQEKLKVGGSAGIINSSLSIEGPLGSKASFIVGGRTTYSDWILGLVNDFQLKNSSTHFYDLNAKLDYSINANNRISAFAYFSNDFFHYSGNAEYDYGNIIGAVKWDHALSERVSGRMSLNMSRYDARVADFSQAYWEHSLRTSIDQKQFSYHLSSNAFVRHHLNGGLGIIHSAIQPGSSVPYNNQSMADTIFLRDENALEFNVYVEDEWDLTPDLGLIAGLRYSGFLTLGYDEFSVYSDRQPLNPGTVAGKVMVGRGEPVSFYHMLEPRISLRYQLRDEVSLKAGYNRFVQYIRQVSNTAVLTPVDYWKACDRFIPPIISNQIAVGFFRNLDKNRYEISAETYFRSLENVMDYKNGAQLVLNENLEQSVVMGKGRAYGLELMVKKNRGIVTGWLAYTWSRSFKKMDSPFDEERINRGEWYPSEYDKPHDLSVFLNLRLSRRFSLSSTFLYSTGRPVTYPEQRYWFAGRETIVYSDRNKYRLPDYHRLDLSLTYEGSIKRKKRWRDSWTFSIYNVYGRKNPFSVFYERQTPTIYNDFRGYELYRFSVVGVPIPSFTYNFWF